MEPAKGRPTNVVGPGGEIHLHRVKAGRAYWRWVLVTKATLVCEDKDRCVKETVPVTGPRESREPDLFQAQSPDRPRAPTNRRREPMGKEEVVNLIRAGPIHRHRVKAGRKYWRWVLVTRPSYVCGDEHRCETVRLAGPAQSHQPEVIHWKRSHERRTPARRRRIAPRERGGRPRGNTQDAAEERTQAIQSRRSLLEIVCWKKEWQWVLAVEVPEELLGNPGLNVLQNGALLSQDDSAEERWHLQQPSGQVAVNWNQKGTGQQALVDLGSEDYLLFKLSGQNLDSGRRVSSPSYGSYLVIAPTTWKRHEGLAGPPPVSPEPTSLDGYEAHFFELEKTGEQKIAFDLPKGQKWVIEANAPRFELLGNGIEDASEDTGPLFGGGPPRVRAVEAQTWEKVKTIVVGEEGRGRGRWRTEFRPDPGKSEQDLPGEVAARTAGWYFLRFYDTADDLIESLDFRFVKGLRGISLSQSPPLPREDGHKSVSIKFAHEPECVIEPIQKCRSNVVRIERTSRGTVAHVAPDPDCDRTHWFIRSENGPAVEVVIQLERIWWALADENDAPAQWTDRCLGLSRQDFAATSHKALWLRLPERWRKADIFVGFEKKQAQKYRVKHSQQTLPVPLRHFGDAPELDRVGTASLCVWLPSFQARLATITVTGVCKYCEFTSSDGEDLLDHVRVSHLEQVFPTLTWEEMHHSDPKLPRHIYKCMYCDFYAPSDDLKNPTSTICRHIEDCHEGERPAFRAVSDPKEIRGNVIRSLPLKFRCAFCGIGPEEEPGAPTRMEHLAQHRRDLYRLQ